MYTDTDRLLGKLNDLVLLMDVHRYDKQPFHIQGLKIISVSDVIGKRTCHFTNLPYKEMGLSSTRLHIPKRLADAKNTAAIADHIFNKSPLFCRWVYISIIEPNGRKYGGEARRLYKREVKDFEQLKVSVQRRPPRTPSSSDSNAEDGFSTIKNPRRISAGKRPRSDSIEVLGEDYRKHRPRLPTKVKRLSFFDMFCCAGGASFGAVEAGFVVSFGLEIDKTVIESFKMNHRGAKALLENAHNFPARATRKEYPVDHVHFSTTCKFFSFAQ
jgi:DNA (cytosine-5)-methyltransferase 1